MNTSTMTRRATDTVDDLGSGRYPRTLLASALAWTTLAIMALLTGVGSTSPTDAQGQRGLLVDMNTLPTDAPTRDAFWWVPYLPAVGLLILLGTALLEFGYGWVRPVLAVVGVLAVVVLAQPTVWLAAAAVLLLVTACAFSLAPGSHRYLRRKRTAHNDVS